MSFWPEAMRDGMPGNKGGKSPENIFRVERTGSLTEVKRRLSLFSKTERGAISASVEIAHWEIFL